MHIHRPKPPIHFITAYTFIPCHYNAAITIPPTAIPKTPLITPVGAAPPLEVDELALPVAAVADVLLDVCPALVVFAAVVLLPVGDPVETVPEVVAAPAVPVTTPGP
jgi:hypothetical protein